MSFPLYEEYGPKVPVWCITPNSFGCIHRFFDTSAISPSGRYVGLTRLPNEDRLPKPGDLAEVVVVDLHTGRENGIARTAGWDTQLGAQVQWGRDDSELFFNDVQSESWKPYCVKMNPATGARKDFDGSIYMVSPDGGYLAAPSLEKLGLTQAGPSLKTQQNY